MVCQQTCKSSHINGLRHATDVGQDRFQAFITQMTTDSIVMWATQLSIVAWVYTKTRHKNGLRLATDVGQDRFHAFITQMTTGGIVMWATQLSIVAWVYTKTQILLETTGLKINFGSRGGRGRPSVSSEAEHLSPSVGCARNKRQYPTVLQNLKSFRWMLDREWIDYLFSTSGTWQLRCCIQTNNTARPIRMAPGNWCGTENHSRGATEM